MKTTTHLLALSVVFSFASSGAWVHAQSGYRISLTEESILSMASFSSWDEIGPNFRPDDLKTLYRLQTNFDGGGHHFLLFTQDVVVLEFPILRWTVLTNRGTTLGDSLGWYLADHGDVFTEEAILSGDFTPLQNYASASSDFGTAIDVGSYGIHYFGVY